MAQSEPEPQDIPWVEKYRPTASNASCSESALVGHQEMQHLFNNMIQQNNALNLLIYGPPGTGKTSQVIMMCQRMYLDKYEYARHVLEINASYDRGIDVVRGKIKQFCKRAVASGDGDGGSSSQGRRALLKFVVLDEADTLSIEAQNALRRCIEMYAYNTRFCFVCNYVTNIIAPILSRCFVWHYKQLEIPVVVERLRGIVRREGLCQEGDGGEDDQETVLRLIANECSGDLRRCITTLQSVHMITPGTLSERKVNEYLNLPPIEMVEEMRAAVTPAQMYDLANRIYYRGYAIHDLIRRTIEWIIENLSDQIPTLARVHIALARLEYKATLAIDERLLLLEMVQIVSTTRL